MENKKKDKAYRDDVNNIQKTLRFPILSTEGKAQ